jgi:hypothetical protein
MNGMVFLKCPIFQTYVSIQLSVFPSLSTLIVSQKVRLFDGRFLYDSQFLPVFFFFSFFFTFFFTFLTTLSFAELWAKHFEVLWRGSGDGFKAKEFHSRCDSHPNTLTVILDTKRGNIFGSFTPLKLESGLHHFKANDSQKIHIFTLKNPPHDNNNNIPARQFALKTQEKHLEIWWNFEFDPGFGISGVVMLTWLFFQ